MKQLVVCSKELPEYYNYEVPSGSINIDGSAVTYALIETADITFDGDKYPEYVLVRKVAVSTNYRDMGVMTHVAAGILRGNPDQLLYYPIGSEFSGVVVAVGNLVKGFRPGDRVIPDAGYPFAGESKDRGGLPTNNAFSELEMLHASKLAVIPDSLSFEQAAAFTIGAQTVYSMISRLNITSGSKVLLLGLSSNTALFALNALKNKSVELTGIARSIKFRDKLLKMGLHQLFVISPDTPNYLENEGLQEYINGKGKFDYIIDPFCNNNLTKALPLMAMNGTYITCGVSNNITTANRQLLTEDILLQVIINNITIKGNCLGASAHLQTALQDYVHNSFEVPIDSIYEQDPQSFMQRSFNDPERFGKVIYKF
ncbi:MDR/zinc-dependent alcohol dehydrogenase-like family protein [Chitinophaga nivalis]|uniref:Medium chain dehydrogenase/reductase family protein n=1 Tax=Chitinophaga nivalis TaxID=2991709 RepID=A0ABT3INM6_9BACT|nr:medium chain dehydrogenase/reductase family protein [Chitinophaga nivalis]MCW3464744.1 medium chain dehydrogenase/reductase family protein [Chitinophaga nivalis]MCW3485565.1 medium chain dehydrogenase/reductase family protein [Chitinophaga nivalis]